MAKTTSRRRFLQTAPLAAAAGVPLSASLLTAEPPAPPVPFKLVTAQTLAEQTSALEAKPGNYSFFENTPAPLLCVLTVEKAKAAKEFEWHEGRDHIFQVLDGETVYEVGGTPANGHATKPGEWLAPTSQGATTMTLKKGDVLIIPRNTPHKRSTASSVTFYLFSSTGAISA